jgi:hypothetical protein
MEEASHIDLAPFAEVCFFQSNKTLETTKLWKSNCYRSAAKYKKIVLKEQ